MTKEPRGKGLILLSLLLLNGCGWATGGVFGLSSDGGSGGTSSDAPAILSDVVIDARTSPAKILFTLADARSNSIDVQLRFQDPMSGKEVDMVLVEHPEQGVDANLSGLNSSPVGVVHEKRWDFAETDQIGTTSLTRDVLVTFQGRDGALEIEPRNLRVDVGNDPPSLTITSPPGRSLTGVVPVEFTVFDSQSDPVTVEASYDLLNDEPDLGFLPARGGTAAGPDGQPVAYFWDAQSDVGFNDHDVALRLVASDGLETGLVAVDLFRVDNNTEPRVEIDSAALVSSSDRRGGIPVPFSLFDGNRETGEAGDEGLVLFQWKYDEQPEFPELPPVRNAEEASVLINDPTRADLRRELQICTEIPRSFDGRLIPVDATTVRLPELATTNAGALERDPRSGELRIRGTFEILRSATKPGPVKDSWSRNPGLVNPVSALPIASGPNALVLEDTGGTWRLRNVNTANGDAGDILAQGPHRPTALAYEPGEERVLVALLQGTTETWELRRVDLSTTDGGEGQRLVSSVDGSLENGPIRGIVSLGNNSALVTAGSSLLKVTFTIGEAPLVATLLGSPHTPLDEPWGIVADPLVPHRVYLAERGRNRILAVSTDRLGDETEIPARGIGVPAHTSLTLESGSMRLLVLTDTDPGDETKELRSLELGSPVDLDEDGLADLEVYEIAGGYAATNVAAGTNGFRILSLYADADLAVGGGLISRTALERGKTAYDPSNQNLRLDGPLDPVPERGAPWRLTRTTSILGTPGGTDGVFVWSSDDARSDNIRIRAIAFDGDRGPESQASASIALRSNLEATPSLLPNPASTRPVDSITTDLDGDGDLDLVTSNSAVQDSSLNLFFQTGARSYSPVVLQNPALATPVSVEAADLDGDGDNDLVSANTGPSNLTLFFQTAPGVFDPDPTVLENSAVRFPRRVVAADLDRDGDLDLAVLEAVKIAVFFQVTPGVFEDGDPLLLEPESVSLAQDLVAGDLDQDGDIDLAASSAGDASRRFVTIFFQTSPGSFELQDDIVLQLPRAIVTISDLKIADLDGDGDLDLVAAGFNPPPENRSSLSLFFQTAPGTFDPTPTVLIDPDLEINRPISVAAADVDRDGDFDLVAADDFAKKIIIHAQIAPGQFDPVPISIRVNGLVGNVNVADLDADGALDLTTFLSTEDLALYFQAIPGSFDPEPMSLQSPELNNPFSVAAADLDHDGDPDLVAANGTSNNLTIFSQTSPGVFDTPTVLEDPNVGGLQSVAAADLDGDGDLDLATANTATDNLALFFQTSPGVFDDIDVLSASFLESVRRVVAVDMDRDGDIDLVSSARNSIGGARNLSILFQSTPGTFDLETRIVIPTPGEAQRVLSVADLDRDGNMDLITGANTSGSDNITLYFQTSPGIFDEINFTAENLKFASAVAAADIDGDGDLDLVVAARSLSPDGANLSILYQTAPREFDLENQGVLSLGGPTAQALAVADLDRDGDLDLVAPGASPGEAGSLAIFLQASPSTFDPVPTYLGLTGSIRQLVVTDVDQDGDPDLLGADSARDRLVIFFGAD